MGHGAFKISDDTDVADIARTIIWAVAFCWYLVRFPVDPVTSTVIPDVSIACWNRRFALVGKSK